jgi:hypothetical protein
VRKGSRVSWIYDGVRTYGKVTALKGEGSFTVKGPTGGTITRRGTKADPVIAITSESTGNPVLKTRSQLRAAPKGKKK